MADLLTEAQRSALLSLPDGHCCSGRTPEPEPRTPALDRWAERHADRRVIQDFLEWCMSRKIELCEWVEDSERPYPCSRDERLLDEYHEIDQQELERERRALLDAHREATRG